MQIWQKSSQNVCTVSNIWNAPMTEYHPESPDGQIFKLMTMYACRKKKMIFLFLATSVLCHQ